MLNYQYQYHGHRMADSRALGVVTRLGLLLAASFSHAVDKQWISGNGDWSPNLNWSPFGVPGLGDTARIGSLDFVADDMVTVDGQFSVGGLEVSNGMRLRIDPGRLVVQGATVISGATTTGVNQTELQIFNGPSAIDFDTDTLSIVDGAEVLISGGRMDVDEQLVIGPGSSPSNGIYGHGTVVLGGAGTAIRNDGYIAGNTNPLTITTVGGGTLDLDGLTGDGRILARAMLGAEGGKIVFDGGTLSDAFGGEMRIVGRGSIAMSLDAPWATEAGSEVRFERHTTSPGAALLSGTEVTIGGAVQVDEEAYGRITAATLFGSGATTSIASNGILELDGSSAVSGGSFDLASGGLLQFDGATTVNGGHFSTATRRLNAGMVLFAGPTTWGDGFFGGGNTTIDGAARQQGAATVTSSHTISGGLLDLDGETGGTIWNINNSLTLNLASIADGITDRFDGAMSISGLSGGLSLNLEEPGAVWEMSGTLNLSGFGGGGFTLTRLSGSEVTVTGEVNVSGGVGIASGAHFTGPGSVDFSNSAAILLMRGESQFASTTTFNGTGTLANHATGQMMLDDGVALSNADLDNRGTFEVAVGPGSSAVNDFTQGAGGEWIFDIGGDFAQTEHDQLVASGSATLAGQLTPRLIDAGSGFFVPSVGDDFTVLIAPGGISGAFDPIPQMAIGGEVFQWEVQYSPTQAQLVLADIGGLLGDYNLDGLVDAADYTVWRDNLGDTTFLAADGNQDGVVNQADYGVWVGNFGASLGVGEVATSVGVPEPATIAIGMLALGMVGLIRCSSTLWNPRES